jgi:hypothetical protein
MAPQVLAIFRAIFAAKERGQAYGLYGAMLGVVSAIGLVLGGVLTEANLFGWLSCSPSATAAGLALLLIPLVNVVLAAVPVEVAGRASGLFSTAQQLGGAIGVAVGGTVFFDQLSGHSFEGAFTHTMPYVTGAFILCGVLSLVLPRTAVADEFSAPARPAASGA